MAQTIVQVFKEAQNRPSGKTASRFKFNGEWKSQTWKDCFLMAETIANGLHSFELSKGDRVALVSNTRFEWWMCDFGIMGAGFVTVPLYQSSLPEDIEYILNNSEAKVLILEDASQVKKWEKIASKCPQVAKVICIQDYSDLPDEILSWQEFLDEGDAQITASPGLFSKCIDESKIDDVATILYTSGTTGEPKGVVLTHRQIMSEIVEVFTTVGIDDTDESLSFLPYSHVMGRIESWGAVYCGFTLNFAESIERIRLNLTEVHPTIMIAVPRIFEKIYSGILSQVEANPLRNKIFKWALEIGKQVSRHRIEGSSLPLPLLGQYLVAKKLVFTPLKEKMGGKLRFAVSGGAPLSAEIARFFHAADLLVLEGYGLTETTAAITVNTPFAYQFGSVGKPAGDVKIKFDKDGEILVKSDKVMREYYKNPTATQQAFTDDGFFRTGDIGEFTSDGFLKITDRKKDLIKTAGGKYVAPQKIENLLKLHRLVSNVLIHGDQKKYIVALITLNEEVVLDFAKSQNLSYPDYASLTQHDLIKNEVRQIVAEANSQLSSFETVKNFAILPKDFTLEEGEITPSLKVKRKFCDQKYSGTIDKLYS